MGNLFVVNGASRFNDLFPKENHYEAAVIADGVIKEIGDAPLCVLYATASDSIGAASRYHGLHISTKYCSIRSFP